MIQPQVMKSVSPTNARVSCNAIPQPDLTNWLEPVPEPKKSTAGTKSTRINVIVKGGSIKTTSGSTLWDGSVPVNIELPLFSPKKLSGPSGEGAFGHGVQWQGVVSVTSNLVSVSGTFSYPVFIHGPIPLGTNYTIKWVNGEFELSLETTSNDTDISQLSLTGNYESPIFFNEEKVDVTDSKKKFVLGETEDTPLVIGDQKLPLILIGSYSVGKTSFYWSGNATITIPSVVKPTLLDVKDLEKPSISGLFNVVGGNVKLESLDGSSTNIWDGNLPVAIPLPLPYKVLMATGSGEKLVAFGNGLEWSASISGSQVEGSFAFPQYSRTVGMVSVNWLNGQFSLQLAPWTKSIDEVLAPGVKYSSRIIFREEPAPANLQLESLFTNDLDPPDSLEDLIVESQEVIEGIIPAPLVLHGTFSPDKNTFYFNGKVILAVRPTKPKIDTQLKSLKGPELSFPSWGSPKFGGTVNTGHLTAGLEGGVTNTIWSGSIPVSIPMPTFFSPVFDSFGGKSFIFGNGVVWSGTLSGTTIKGTYSLPQSIWSMSGIKQQTWNGDFSFEINSLWNATLGSIFVPGAKYYSKIHFQGTKYETGLSSLNGVPGEDPTVSMSAPIILQGSHSLDKKTFYWTGSFIIVFHNKPTLMFTVPKKPKNGMLNKSDTKPKSSIEIDITSGSIVAGFTGTNPEQVWTGTLPVTIPYGSLVSKDSWSTLPSSNVMWSGDVKDNIFKGTFAIPTYVQNDTTEIVQWWAGNFSFQYTTKWGALLEDYVRAGKKYDFSLFFAAPKKAVNPMESNEDQVTNPLVRFTKEAQEVLDDSKSGKLVLRGAYYSKPFYCYIIPFCSEKQEYYWSGSAILAFPDPPKNKTTNELKLPLADVQTAEMSSQFGGKAISGSVEGGLNKDSLNIWWSGNLPVKIPTSIFWTNKTGASSVLTGGYGVEWSGQLIGNTLKGTFSFPQIVMDFPVPSVQWWTGQFSFEIEPLWNTSLNGLILSEVQYVSSIHLQGLKVTDNNDEVYDKKFVLNSGAEMKQIAPIILQGTFSPDGSSFLWSGQFIMSVKSKPNFPKQSLMKSKDKIKLDADVLHETRVTATDKVVKPKTTVSFTIITGQLSATNGSDPVQIWGGERPIDINLDMLNPTNTPGAGASIMWSADSVSPQISGTFSVTVFSRNGSILLPVTWSGNFSMHYLIKWSGSFDGLVKPGKMYTCSLIFKELAQLQSPGYIDEPTPKQSFVGAGESSATPCTLILDGKTHLKGGSPFYCKVVPFMCSNDPVTTWFSFNGEAMIIIKPPTNIPAEELIFQAPPPPPVNIQLITPRRINTTVVSGSIVAGPESEYPRTLWSGSFPLTISLPVFWNSEDSSDVKIPLEDLVHAHGIIWSGSQMGPRIEGSFSLPQYTKTGIRWWTGRFTFLFQTNWGMLGDLDGLIKPDINYYSKIIFRDINTPAPLLAPSQFDIDTSTSMPIILLGTYTSSNIFKWSGNVIIAIRNNPWNFVNKSSNLKLGGVSSDKWPTKPKENVGVVVKSGSLTNSVDGQLLPVWSGSFPVKIPITEFNISKGLNVIWTATTVYPKLSGNFSIPQYVKNAEGFKIEWTDGTFTFDLTTLWNTSVDLIEIGKQYATIVSAETAKLTKLEEEDMYNSFLALIMESENLKGSEIAKLNLKGNFTPDNMYFAWDGEAWFYPDKNKTVGPKQLQLGSTGTLRANQFGGAIYDGSVTSESSSIFSFSRTIWSGYLPAEIPFSLFGSGSFFGGSKFTPDITWTASSITDSYVEGSYSIPQYSWNGISRTVTWYKGNFKFYVRPLWNATLTSLIQPGIQYYSRISLQGGGSALLNSNEALGSVLPGVPLSIILQGTNSPDHTSFFWTGNFIMNAKKVPKLQLGANIDPGKNNPLGGFVLANQFGGTVTGGSVTTGASSFFSFIPQTIWSGEIPAEIPFSAFWPGMFGGSKLIRGMTWIATSVTESSISGTYSLSQISWIGFSKAVTYYSGNFKFDLTPLWNMSLAETIQLGTPYYSKISFQGMPATLQQTLEQAADPDPAGIKVPIILQGTYAPDGTAFLWNGNFIMNFKIKPPKPEKPEKIKVPKLKLGADSKPGKTEKVKEKVGVIVSSVTLSNRGADDQDLIWSANPPFAFPVEKFNISRGVNVIWSASTLYPKFAGNFSMAQFSSGSKYPIEWIYGTFSLDLLMTMWNTTLNVIEVGKQYTTMISSDKTKFEKSEKKDMYDSFFNLISDSTAVEGSPIGRVILKGTFTPDNMNFNWLGSAWFYPNNNKTAKPISNLKNSLGGFVLANQFGGTVTGGSVTTGASSFFSFIPQTIWSGEIPAEIPFSAFWPGMFGGSKLIRGMTWIATSVTESSIAGTYSVSQVSWIGFSKAVTYYSGSFQFDIKPLWNASLVGTIQLGTPYYSKISFQGMPATLQQTLEQAADPDPAGIKVPIILQGTYAPEGTAFLWNGNFIMNFKIKPPKPEKPVKIKI